MRSERSLNNQLNLRTEKMTSKNDGGPLSLTCKHRVETAREVSSVGYKSVFQAENSFAPTLVGEAYAAGEQERGLPGRADLDPLSIPGFEYYRQCPERIAGRCGRFPADWSDWDKQVWISGCGRRDYCAAARSVVGGRR